MSFDENPVNDVDRTTTNEADSHLATKAEEKANRAAAKQAALEEKKAAHLAAQATKAEEKANRAAAKQAALEEKKAAHLAAQATKAEEKANRAAAKQAAKQTAEQTTPEAKQAAKPAKEPKDPYRPRFAVAPGKVRVFTILAAAFAVMYTAGAVLLLLEATSSPVLGVLPAAAPSVLVYVGAAVSLLVAGLWAGSASLLCVGRLPGKHLGIAALVLGLPLSVVAAPLLFSDDVRDWAL